jgi:hypothetical protein
MNGGIFIYLLFLLGVFVGATYLLLRIMRFLENKTYEHFDRIERRKLERKER